MKNRLILLTIITATSLVFNSCGHKHPKNKSHKKIAVTGSAEMEVVPDEIYMTFTLKEYLDASKQKIKLDDVKSQFLSVCRSAGVADSNVVIAGYTGNERWDYYNYRRRRTEPDFMASIAYSVKVGSADKLDQIVAAVNDQALDNFYISKTSHSKIEELRKEVKMNALKASKEKAEYLAKSIGEEIGEAQLIQEIDDSYISDVSGLSNTGSYSKTMVTGDQNFGGAAPEFEKIKLRYLMNCEFGLK